MIKYKIGDRVMNVSDSLVPKNSCGTVSFTTVLGDIIGITWDEIGFRYTHKDLIAPLIDVRIDTNYNLDIEKIAKQVDESVRGKGIGFTFINGNTLEVKKEKESMLNLEFKTEEGYRIDKTCNKQIPTIKTTVSSETYPWKGGVATCDKADYEERQGILEALANLICNGNFDREYQRTKARYKKEYAEDCKCQKCGKSFATPELARECEKAHEERRKAKREKYLMHKAAIKRAKEMEIEQMAKDILKEKK